MGMGPYSVDIRFSIWSANNGIYFEEAIVRHGNNDDGMTLPHGWDLDFSACPSCYQPRLLLKSWIAVQGHSRRKRHSNLLAIINGMRTVHDIQVMMDDWHIRVIFVVFISTPMH